MIASSEAELMSDEMSNSFLSFSFLSFWTRFFQVSQAVLEPGTFSVSQSGLDLTEIHLPWLVSAGIRRLCLTTWRCVQILSRLGPQRTS